MATDEDGDKRHVGGPRAVGGLVARLTKPAFRRRSPATAQILADWETIVGPALAAVTAPRRLTSGTLTLACSGPIAMELQHMSGELIARINGHVGRVTVDRLRFVQDTPPQPLDAPPPSFAPAMPDAVEGIPPGALQDALARLGHSIKQAKRRR